MRRYFAALLAVTAPLAAQTAGLRTVSNGILVSGEYPAASIAVNSAFGYVGGQNIDILKVAGAEQHFFIEAGPDHAIKRFYWLQFEHYYPTNSYKYDYSEIKQTPVQLGSLAFGADVRVREHYFTMDDRPGSDSKAAEQFLRDHGLVIDGTFATVRMFALADTTRRRELMIIYGEVMPGATAKSPAPAGILDRAKAGLQIR